MPYYSEDAVDLFESVKNDVSVACKDLLSKMMDKDNTGRAGVGDYLSHTFIHYEKGRRVKSLTTGFSAPGTYVMSDESASIKVLEPNTVEVS